MKKSDGNEATQTSRERCLWGSDRASGRDYVIEWTKLPRTTANSKASAATNPSSLCSQPPPYQGPRDARRMVRRGKTAHMSFADKACHNCRRKRLRCDRSVPQCVKCSTAGRQCLGYGNLLRWTGAVASRGRLAGQTSFAPPPAALPGAGQPPRPFAGSSPVAEWTYSGQTSALAVALPAAAPRPEDAAFSYDARMQLVARLASDDGGDDDGDVEAELSSPWVLTDPLYQDMNYSSRHYLNYCMPHINTCLAAPTQRKD